MCNKNRYGRELSSPMHLKEMGKRVLPVIWAALTVLALFYMGVPSSWSRAFGAEADIWVELWRHEPSEPVTGIDVVWPGGSSTPVLAAVSGDRVTVYRLGEDGPRFVTAINELSPAPTAVKVRTLSTSEVELWIGTQAPGIVYVYRLDLEHGSAFETGRIRFAWDDIVKVLPFDLDGWGELDVALVTKGSTLHLFRWTRDGYQDVSLGTNGRNVADVALGPVRAPGGRDLVVARERDQILVLRWELSSAAHEVRDRLDTDDALALHEDGGEGTLIEAWENYVWGAHVGLFVGSFAGGNRAQIAVLSLQNLVYRFEWTPEPVAVVAVGTPLTWREPHARLIGIGDLGQTGFGQLLQATESGLVSWRISSDVRRVQRLELSLAPIDWAFVGPNHTLVVAQEQGFAFLQRRPPGYFRLLHRGREVRPQRPIQLRSETAFLSAEDWRRFFGIALRWDEKSGRVTGVRGFRFIVGQIGQSEWIVDGRSVDLKDAPFVDEGQLYVPISFGAALGLSVEWEPYSYTLILD